MTSKTAWRMFNKIRTSLMTEPEIAPLAGKVEVDETYFSRSRRNRPAEQYRPGGSGPSSGERTVFGMVERQRRVIARHVSDATANTLSRGLDTHVLPSSMVFTDMHSSYRRTGQHSEHYRVNHTAKVYGDGDVHTQTIEGFWSLVKRGISGTYHLVSAEYLQTYLDEYAFRYNHREVLPRCLGQPPVSMGEVMFRLILARAATPREPVRYGQRRAVRRTIHGMAIRVGGRLGRRMAPRAIRESAAVLDFPNMLHPALPPPDVWNALGNDWRSVGADIRRAMAAERPQVKR